MTDAERQVAGKTYRITKSAGPQAAGQLVSYDDAGKQASGPGLPEAELIPAAYMLYLLSGTPWAEEVLPSQKTETTPEPEVKVNPTGGPLGATVKVGDRFEDSVKNVLRVESVCDAYLTFRNGLGTKEHWTIVTVLKYEKVGRWRRLPPEPAKPLCSPTDVGTSLCECGNLTNTNVQFCDECIKQMDLCSREGSPSQKELCEACGEEPVTQDWNWRPSCCGRLVPLCDCCYNADFGVAANRHRVLKHPEPKAEGCVCRRHLEYAHYGPIDGAWRCAGPTTKARKDKCVCLSASCSACGPKLESDGTTRECMDEVDQRRRARLSKGSLESYPRYSPTAMMGGMWPVHGRK